MTTAAQRPTLPRLQLSAFGRVGVALAVLCVAALAWDSAGQASRERVQSAKAEISRGAMPVATLPRVEVVVRRDAAPRNM